jgi:hypothetical protein
MLVGARLRSDECDGSIAGRMPGFGSPFMRPVALAESSAAALLFAKMEVVFA